MELVRGESLRARIKRAGALPPAEVRRIGLALLDGLAAAHDARIIHRDVKPANILIDEHDVVKLVDFGIASFGDRDLTSTGVRIGTPAYMAPEQLRGRVADVRADIYAVGATLFEAATGTQLHGDDDTAKDVRAAVVAAAGDAELASAIERAVAERAEDRFPDCRAFAAALGATTGARPARRRRWPLAIAGVAVAATAAVVVGIARHDAVPVTAAGSGSARVNAHVIALMPFVDNTHETQLDFTPSGLPNILARELEKIPELHVVGYYDLLDQIADPAAPASAWAAAARSLGAEVIVRGTLDPEQTGVRLVVEIESITGASLGRFERTTTADAVVATTRASAEDIARVAVGRSTPAAGASQRLDIERDLQLGIAALQRQDFDSADTYLHKVDREAPDLADAQYYLALLNWWVSRDANKPVERALAGNLDPARHGVMEGLRIMLRSYDLIPAIDKFRELAKRFPDHRDVQYGLFESLYHGGFAAEAMTVYRQLGERHPQFRLGLKHALAYYIGHANDDGMRWASARLDDKFKDTVLWQARLRVARRDYKGAIAWLQHNEASEASPTGALHRELVGIALLDGQLGLVDDLVADWPRQDLPHTATPLLALSLARGRSEQATLWRDKAASAAAMATGEDELERGWLELAAVAQPEATPVRLKQIANALRTNGPMNETLAWVLVGGALGDASIVTAAHASKILEVAAIADAYRAESAADWKHAAESWQRAITLAADGLFVIDEQLAAARVARTLRDPAAVLAACDEVIRPRRFTWAWGSAVGPCLRWSAEAATELQRTSDAAGYWQRLLALRSDAPPDDELARAARAGLAAPASRP
jgi:TolB-like protein